MNFNYYNINYMLTNFDVANYLIAAIIILAMVLAVFNEDASTGSTKLMWILTELLPIQESMHKSKLKIEKNILKKKDNKIYSFYIFVYDIICEIKKSLHEKNIYTLIKEYMHKLYKKIKIYKDVFILKYQANSKRHLFYLLMKKKYNLAIDKNETEMKSYLDAKRQIIKDGNWAFMWTVSNVKNDYITCENMKVRTISSYSYLDFIREPLVQQFAIEAAKVWSTGNHGPRMLGGNSQILRDLEKIVGKFFYRNDSILCVCGFLACMSGIVALGSSKNVLILYDCKNHECIKLGIKITGAANYTYRHNDYNELEKLIIKHRHKYKDCWICVESVYSMDGDITDLPVVKSLCNKYNCKLFIDEAHGLGTLGKTGRGLEDHYNMIGAADVIVGTFSKSLSTVGGFIVASDDLIEYLDFHSIGNVFSAPLPAYCAGAAIKAFELIDQQPWRIEKLQFNAKYLRENLKTGMNLWPKDYPDEHKFTIGGDDGSSVIPVIFYNDPDRMIKICKVLLKMKWMVSAVAYPACSLKSPRFRITASCHYNIEYMNNFIKDIITATVSVPPTPFDSKIL